VERKKEVKPMKKIEAIIDPSKMQEVKNALTKIGIQRMTISKVDEFGSHKAHKEFYRTKEFIVDVVEEFKIELMVPDEMLSQVLGTIYKATKTENTAGGEVFISPVEEGSRFRYPSDCA
jgi:nitrogen regulatory protein P-II 1